MATAQELIGRSIPFLEKVKDRTAGDELETWLNETHRPGRAVYDGPARMITEGVRGGWASDVKVDGRKYRRGRIAEPHDVSCFSSTAVYTGTGGNITSTRSASSTSSRRWTPTPSRWDRGWSGPGWTAPGPGSHHYREVKAGALIALFYLPAGRISYDITPPAV